MTPSQDTRIWYDDAHHSVATLGPLIVQIWRGEHTMEHWAKDMEPIAQHVKAQHAGMLNLTIMEASAHMPSTTAREEMAFSVKAHGGINVASALIMPGTGMQQTMVRAAVAATRLVIGQSGDKLRTFTDLEEALRYLGEAAQKAGLPFDPVGVTGLVRSLREKKSAAG